MPRPPQIDAEHRLAMFLHAVGCHPWARVGFVQASSGLHAAEFRKAATSASTAGWAEAAVIRLLRRSPKRYALTPAGAARINAAFDWGWQRRAFLQALKLDLARDWLHHQMHRAVIVWSWSPYCVPAAALRPAPPATAARTASGDWTYRSLHLDGLACLRLDDRRYINVALLVDAGDIKLDWLFHQFRAAQAWARRPEFERPETAFPVFVTLTNERRWSDAVQLWREAAPRREVPRPLRVVLITALDRDWGWDEHGQGLGVWSGVAAMEQPSAPPAMADMTWPGSPTIDTTQPHMPAARTPRRAGLLRWAAHSDKDAARLVRDHATLSLRARRLLDRIGQYPLIRVDELAIVMGCGAQNATDGLHELKRSGLIEHPAPSEVGYVLTWRGLSLLAAQAGSAPIEYARLRRWPIRVEAGEARYSAESWLAARDHTRIVLEFLVGLRRSGPRAHWRLVHWDHVYCLRESPTGVAASVAGLRAPLWRVIPDAAGTMQLAGRLTPRLVDFWLEVDRGTIQGQALTAKLARYCQVSANQRPRLLIVVKRDDEARLQTVRRRLNALDAQYRAGLDVRLTRVDLLSEGPRRLDPTRNVWRTLSCGDFVSAFGVER